MCVSLYENESSEILLIVEDDGIGFENPELSDDAEFLRRHNFGIVLMMEAAKDVGGKFSIRNGNKGARTELKLLMS